MAQEPTATETAENEPSRTTRLDADKTTVFLVYAFHSPRGTHAGDQGCWLKNADAAMLGQAEGKAWKPKNLDLEGVLPHMSEDIVRRRGAADATSVDSMLAAYERGEALGNVFEPRTGWKLDSGVTFQISAGTPHVYLTGNGYAFIVLGVRPKAENIEAFLDALYALARRGNQGLSASTTPEKSKAGARIAEWLEGADPQCRTVRDFLYDLLPAELELDRKPPRGTRPLPFALCAVYADGPLGDVARNKLRLMQKASQDIVPAAGDLRVEGHNRMWRPSAAELCLTSPLGMSWVAERSWQDKTDFLHELRHMVRDKYVYKWILAQVQRLVLLDISADCARSASRLDAYEQVLLSFSTLHRRMMQFKGRYYFAQLSEEERDSRFYEGMRKALEVEPLYQEVMDEVAEFKTYVDARRVEREAESDKALNRVIALLTLVFTPAGLVIGVFQSDTLPPAWKAWFAGSPNSLAVLHWPLWALAIAMALGLAAFGVSPGRAEPWALATGLMTAEGRLSSPERLHIGSACGLALATGLGASSAVGVHSPVPLTFRRAQLASEQARLKLIAYQLPVRGVFAGELPRRGEAGVRAIEVAANALHELLHHVLGQAGIGARRAGKGALGARADARDQLLLAPAGAGGMGLQNGFDALHGFPLFWGAVRYPCP